MKLRHRAIHAGAFLVALVFSSLCLAQPVRGPTTRPAKPRPISRFSSLDQAKLLAALEKAKPATSAPDEQVKKNAIRDCTLIYGELSGRFADNTMVYQWRSDALWMLQENLESVRKRAIYEITSQPECDEALGWAQDAQQFLIGEGEIHALLEKMANADQIKNNKEYDRIEKAEKELKLFAALMDFYLAQFTWSKGAPALDGTPKAKVALDKWKEQMREYERSVKDYFQPVAGRSEPPERRLYALRCMGWTALFAGNIDDAMAKADEALKACEDMIKAAGELPDPKAKSQQLFDACQAKFEVFALKALALRAGGSFGDPSPDKLSGAFAVLEEQAKLLPELKSFLGEDEKDWRMCNLLGKANCMVYKAAKDARDKFAKADKQAVTSKEAADKLRETARAEYVAARRAARDLFVQEGRRDPSVAKSVAGYAGMIHKDLDIDASSELVAATMPSDEDLKLMDFTDLLERSQRIYRDGQDQNGTKLSEILLSWLDSPEKRPNKSMKADILYDLASAYYRLALPDLQGATDAEQGAAAADKLGTPGAKENAKRLRDEAKKFADKAKGPLGKAEQRFKELLKEKPDHPKKVDILGWVFRGMIWQGDFQSDDARRAAVATVGKEWLTAIAQQQSGPRATWKDATGDDAKWVLGKLANVHYRAAEYPEAIEEWKAIPTTGPDGWAARDGVCRAVSMWCEDDARRKLLKPAELKELLDELDVLTKVIEPAVRQRAQTQPDFWKGPTPTSQPQDRARLMGDPVAWYRFRGASFQVDHGNFLMQFFTDVETQNAGAKIMADAARNHPDLVDLNDMVQQNRIGAYLRNDQFDQAVEAVLDFVRSRPEVARQVAEIVLKLRESEYQQAVMDGRDQAAMKVAKQADDFLVTMIEKGKAMGARFIAGLSVLRGRYLNRQKDYAQAAQVLARVYESGESWKKDPVLAIELADAHLGLAMAEKDPAKKKSLLVTASVFYELILQKASEFDPAVEPFSETSWRALVGDAESYLSRGAMLRNTYSAICDEEKAAAAKAEKITDPTEPDPRVPKWLKPRFDKAKRDLEEILRNPPAGPNQPGADAKPAKRSGINEVGDTFKKMLLLMGVCLVGLGIVVGATVLRIRSQRKNKLIIRARRRS